MTSTSATVSVHVWREQAFREPTYQIAFGVERVCQVCHRKQFTDYTSGRTGGNWVEVTAPTGEPKFDHTIDTTSGCSSAT